MGIVLLLPKCKSQVLLQISFSPFPSCVFLASKDLRIFETQHKEIWGTRVKLQSLKFQFVQKKLIWFQSHRHYFPSTIMTKWPKKLISSSTLPSKKKDGSKLELTLDFQIHPQKVF